MIALEYRTDGLPYTKPFFVLYWTNGKSEVRATFDENTPMLLEFYQMCQEREKYDAKLLGER